MSSIRPPSFPPLREDVPLTRTARLARTGLQEDAVALLDDSVELVEALSDDWDRQTYILCSPVICPVVISSVSSMIIVKGCVDGIR